MLSSAAFNPDSYAAAWEELGKETYDCVIIGGGSVGAGAALDAATRGLKVAVVESRDFAAGTSSRSSKMFHGGLRYLEMLDFKLVAESLRERELNMATLAPHLVTPLRFIFPLTRRVWERGMMFAGFTLYDLMGGAKTVPHQKHLSKTTVLKHNPGLKPTAITGGVRYFDTLVDDARHTMTVLRTAASYGATVRPSTQVVGFLKDNGRVVSAILRDTDTGEETTVKASVFINATGVWNDHVEDLAGARSSFKVTASKGVHLVVPKRCLDVSAALCFPTEKSVLFVIPWGEYWIIGTTDTPYEGNLPDPAVTATDINYLLDEVNQRVATPITHDDIVGVYAGLRPLVAGTSEKTTNLSRNHAVARACLGLISVAGGKYTTYRVIGKDVVDRAIDEARCAPTFYAQGSRHGIPESITDRTPILGADGYHALKNALPAIHEQYGVSLEVAEHLLGRYGSLFPEVLAPAQEHPDLLRPLEHAPGYLRAEALYACTHEGALHLEDILERRLRVAIEYPDRGQACATEVAELVAQTLGWDDATTAEEIDRYTRRVKAEAAACKEITEEAANQIMADSHTARTEMLG